MDNVGVEDRHDFGGQTRPPGSSEPTRFEYRHVRVDGDRDPIVEDFCAVIPALGLTVIVGPSGAGKTTLSSGVAQRPPLQNHTDASVKVLIELLLDHRVARKGGLRTRSQVRKGPGQGVQGYRDEKDAEAPGHEPRSDHIGQAGAEDRRRDGA
jgi:hypothetical protein